jgi:hypothetical protein
MNSDDQHWLDSITLYVQRNPQIAPYVARYAAIGLENAIKGLRQQLADYDRPFMSIVDLWRGQIEANKWLEEWSNNLNHNSRVSGDE